MSASIQSPPGRGRPRPTVDDLVSLQRSIRADLHGRILSFCARRGISPGTVGSQAVKDARIIYRLADKTTEMGPRLLGKIERYLNDNERVLRNASGRDR